MPKVTNEDLRKVQEPCKSCKLTASGQGKNRVIYCNYLGHPIKLMGEGNPSWYEIPDCPKKTRSNDKETKNEL
jgi:hypothetical protein